MMKLPLILLLVLFFQYQAHAQSKNEIKFDSIELSRDINIDENKIFFTPDSKHLIGFIKTHSGNSMVHVFNYSIKNEKYRLVKNVLKKSVQISERYLSFITKQADEIVLNIWVYGEETPLIFELVMNDIDSYRIFAFDVTHTKRRNILGLFSYKIDSLKNTLKLYDFSQNKSETINKDVIEWRGFSTGDFVFKALAENTYSLQVGNIFFKETHYLLNNYADIQNFNPAINNTKASLAFYAKKEDADPYKIYYCNNLVRCLNVVNETTIGFSDTYRFNTLVPPTPESYWFRLYFEVVEQQVEKSTNLTHTAFIFPNATFKRLIVPSEKGIQDVILPRKPFSTHALGCTLAPDGTTQNVHAVSMIDGNNTPLKDSHSRSKYYINHSGKFIFWLSPESEALYVYNIEEDRSYNIALPLVQSHLSSDIIQAKMYEVDIDSEKSNTLLIELKDHYYLADIQYKKKKFKDLNLSINKLIASSSVNIKLDKKFTNRKEGHVLWFFSKDNTGMTFYSKALEKNTPMKKVGQFPDYTKDRVRSRDKNHVAFMVIDNENVRIYLGIDGINNTEKIFDSEIDMKN